MNTQTTDRLSPLIFDFDQWRRDIQTFSEETQNELSLIISELSGAEPTSAPRIEKEFTPSPEQPHSEEESPANLRLASLKEKLFDRITHPQK